MVVTVLAAPVDADPYPDMVIAPGHTPDRECAPFRLTGAAHRAVLPVGRGRSGVRGSRASADSCPRSTRGSSPDGDGARHHAEGWQLNSWMMSVPACPPGRWLRSGNVDDDAVVSASTELPSMVNQQLRIG